MLLERTQRKLGMGRIKKGRFEYKTAQGREWCIAKAKERSLTLLVSLEDWLKLKPVAQTPIAFRCDVCKIVRSSNMNRLQVGSKLRCWCNLTVRAPDPLYLEKIQAVLKEREMTSRAVETIDSWRCAVSARGTYSRIDATCLRCQVEGSIQVGHLANNETRMFCLCNGLVRWSSETGYNTLMSLVEESRFSFSKPTLDEWTATNPTFSTRLSLRCTDCDTNTSPTIKQFFRGQAGCLCRNSSEGRVGQLLDDALQNTTFKVVPQYFDTSLKGPSCKWPLRFDFAIVKGGELSMIVEVDGGHHFGFGHAKFATEVKAAQYRESDLKKEQFCIAKNVSMLRIEADTIRLNAMDWHVWLQLHVQAMIGGQLSAGIRRLSRGDQYSVGVYADKRKDVPSLHEAAHCTGVLNHELPCPKATGLAGTRRV